MTTRKKWLISAGWIAYVFTWLTLIANITHDWLTRRWISPLSLIILALLSGGTVVQLARGEPVIQTEGVSNRLVPTLVLILLIWVIILGWTVLRFIG